MIEAEQAPGGRLEARFPSPNPFDPPDWSLAAPSATVYPHAMKRHIAAVVLGICSTWAVGLAWAQPTSTRPMDPPRNAPKAADPTWHALINATVHVSPGRVVERATVVMRDGRIVSVEGSPPPRDGQPARSPEPPIGARVWDCAGRHIYAGFIDAYVEVDAPAPARDKQNTHWNPRVMPDRSALDGAGVDARTSEALRKLGFAAAAIVPRDGVFRGASAVVSLAQPPDDRSAERPPVYQAAAYHAAAFDLRNPWGGGRDAAPDVSRWSAYPNSQMGAIALIRQTLSDADWQASARLQEHDLGPTNPLDALWKHRDRGEPVGQPRAIATRDGASTLPQMPIAFVIDHELEALRAIKIAGEFSRPLIIVGCGTEFRRLDAIVESGKPGFIIPLNYPQRPRVDSLGAAEAVELRDLMTWEQAPTNARRLDAEQIHIALTTARLRDRAAFAENLRSAIRHGLPPDRALAALTTHPAAMLGVQDLGAVVPGARANLVITDGDLFAIKPAGAEEDTDARQAKILDVWIDGQRHEINKPTDTSAVGEWILTEYEGEPFDPDAADTPAIIIDDKNAVTIRVGDTKIKATSVRIEKGVVSYVYDAKTVGIEGIVADQSFASHKSMVGVSRLPDGAVKSWKAVRKGDPPKEPARDPGMTGRYRVTTIDDAPVTDEQASEIQIKADKSIAVTLQGVQASADEPAIDGDSVTFAVNMAHFEMEGVVRVSVVREGDLLRGSFISTDGDTHALIATRIKTTREPDDPTKDIPEVFGYPFGPYMMLEPPPQHEVVIVHGASIWTCGPQGVINNGWMIVRRGKIAEIGSGDLRYEGPTGTVIIDATGKHITPGLIDCHSHTGISRGVNESGRAVTAEVRIGDVTDPDSINWYRQLAGGTTTVNSLHGSANPIGGQNQVNKVRWGAIHSDHMHFEGAKPGIKFALGENVKQSNWGDRNTVRYPQTRMGVETIIRDRFITAREYLNQWTNYPYGVLGQRPNNSADNPTFITLPRTMIVSDEADGSPLTLIRLDLPPRRDLELEALGEILLGERLIHCHSYRQDEILMLCRVAAEFDFTIGTFQHVLEGYKVADEVARYAIGASAFSDWWAYKVEVQDAIPHNGAIMWEQGVNVSFNSDSDELARRMNDEAAKAVRYGGVPEEEALKFVTINPAIQLAIDSRVGSLEPGKDADFVIWSGHPLSSLSRCEATWIDGREYYSIEQDQKHRERIAAERQRLIQKILAQGDRGGSRARPGASPSDAPTLDPRLAAMQDDERREYQAWLLRRYQLGQESFAAECGDCGTSMPHARHHHR